MAKTRIILKPKYGVVRGVIPAKLFLAAQRLPGASKWADGALIFDHSKANLDIVLDACGPDVEVIDEADRLQQLKEAHGQRGGRLDERPCAVPRLKLPPFDHQQRAVAWGCGRAFGMYRMGIGTGKSYTILLHAAQLFAENAIDRVLIISRPVVIDDFRLDYLPHQFPDGVPYAAHIIDTQRSPKWKQFDRSRLQFGFVTPQLFASPKGLGLIEQFVKLGRCAIFVDESHDFSNPFAKRTKALHKIGARAVFKFMLTGTLTPRGLENLFAQYGFLHPDIIGHSSFTSFRTQYCIMGGFEFREIVGYREQEKLMALVAPHTFFTDIRDCFDMPEQTWRIEKHGLRSDHVEMIDELKVKFITMLKDAKRELDQRVREIKASGGTHADAVAAARRAMDFTRVVSSAQAQHVAMRGIAHGYFRANPVLDDAGSPVSEQPPPVFLHDDRVNPIIERMLDDRRPILIWCAYRDDVDHVVRAFRAAKHDVGTLVGGMSVTQKQEVLRLGRANELRAIVGTVGAGGTGLNMQFAAHQVYFSNSYAWGDREQAEGRIWRAGQHLPCIYTDMMCTAPVARTIDQGYRDNLKRKTNINLSLSGFLKMAAAFERGDVTFEGLFAEEDQL